VLARALTGRWAFLVAGLIDLFAVLFWLVFRRKSGHLF